MFSRSPLGEQARCSAALKKSSSSRGPMNIAKIPKENVGFRLAWRDEKTGAEPHFVSKWSMRIVPVQPEMTRKVPMEVSWMKAFSLSLGSPNFSRAMLMIPISRLLSIMRLRSGLVSEGRSPLRLTLIIKSIGMAKAVVPSAIKAMIKMDLKLSISLLNPTLTELKCLFP